MDPETEVSFLEEECAELRRKLDEVDKMSESFDLELQNVSENLESVNELETELADQYQSGEQLKLDMER